MSTNEHKKLQIEKLQKYEGQNEYTKYQKTNSTSDLNQKLSTRRTAEKKVDSSFPFSLNSTKVAQPDLATILQQRRKVKEMDIEISPEIAAIVVKQYLIPMFKVGDRNMNDKKRKNELGLTQEDETQEKEMDPIKGTVLEELKLSEKLLQELKLAKNDLRAVTQKLKDLEQSMIGMKSEIQQANNQKIQADIDIQLINYQSNLNYQESSSKLLETYIDQIQSLEQKYKESEDKRIQFANLLYNEKALNDKLKNKANELEHGNAILKLENDIMGERLKNLYQSINEMLNRKFLEEKLQNEMKAIGIQIQKLISFHQNLLEQITNNLQKFDNLKEDLSEMTRYRKELLFEHKQLVHKSKEKISKLEINLENLKDENINLTLQVADLNKKNADISEQYEQLRTKMKQYKSRFNKYTVSEEKICKNCNKYFVEKENFN